MSLTPGRFAGQVLDARATTSQRGFSGRTAASIGRGQFSPIELSPLLWLDASDTATITESSGSVSAWADKSGNGYSAVQATGAAQPTTGSTTINALNVLAFDGGDSLSIASFNMTGGTAQQFTVFAVFTCVSGSDRIVAEHSANFNTNAGAWILFRTNSNVVQLARSMGNSAGYSARNTTGTVTTTAKAFVGTCNVTLATNEVDSWLNGDNAGTMARNNNTVDHNRDDTLYIGARAGTSSFLDGNIAELGVCTRVISTPEREALERYLSAKWGLGF